MATHDVNRKGTDRRKQDRRVRNEPVDVERRVKQDQRENPERRKTST